MVSLVVLTDQADPLWEKVHELRYEVLRRPIGIAATRPHPLDTPASWHVLAIDAETQRLVGVASFSPETGRLFQMAVVQDRRGAGLGRAIVQRVVAEARQRNVREVTLHARHYAIPFYRKLGFTEHGDHFTEVGMEHATMSLPL
jgi:predicted GNAT family N-acyltransferase